MVLDSSAVVAILLQEEGHRELKAAVDASPVVQIGAPTLLETGIVLTARFGPGAGLTLKGFLESCEARVVAFGPEHWPTAVAAFSKYGKGKHPARLNMGDCLSYAVAKVARQPLLFVGRDFAQTDIEPAL